MSSDRDIEIRVSADSSQLKPGLADARTLVTGASQDMIDALNKMAAQSRASTAEMNATLRAMTDKFKAESAAVNAESARMAEGMKANFRGMQTDVTSAFSSMQVGLAKFNNAMFGIQNVLSGGHILKEFVAEFTKEGMEVGKLARTFGITSDAANSLNVQLKLVGMSAEDMTGIAFKMMRQLKTNEDGLKSLGMNTKQNLLDVIKDGARLLNEYKEGYDRNAVAMMLFGRSAEEAMKILKMNADVERRAGEMRQQFGIGVTKEAQEAARDYKVEMNAVGIVLEEAKQNIGEKLLPVLMQAAQETQKLAATAAENKEVFISLGAVAIGGVLTNAIRGMVVSLKEKSAAMISSIADSMKLAQANLAAAQTQAASAAATRQHAQMLLAEAEAAVASASGMARLSLATSTLIPARERLAAATAAAAEAEAALAVATKEASVAATLAGRAMTALGGPIGVIVTLIGAAATAWVAFGDNGEDAMSRVANAGKSVEDRLERIKKQQKFGAGDAGEGRANLELARSQMAEMRKARQASDEFLAGIDADYQKLKKLEKDSLELIALAEKHDGEKPKGTKEFKAPSDGEKALAEFQKEFELLKAKQEAGNQYIQFSKQQEQAFWQAKLAMVAKGSEDEKAITLKLMQAKAATSKETADANIKTMEAELGKMKGHYDEQIALAKTIGAAKQAEFAKDPIKRAEIAQETAIKVKAIEEKAAAESKKLAEETIKAKRKAEEDAVAIEEEIANQQLAMGHITNAEKLAMEQEFEDRRFAIKEQAQADLIAAQLNDPNHDPVALQKELHQMEEIQRQHELKKLQIAGKQKVEGHKGQKTVEDTAEGGMAGGLTAVLMKEKTAAKALQDLYKSVASTFLTEMVTKPLAQLAMRFVRESALYRGMMGKIAAFFGFQKAEIAAQPAQQAAASSAVAGAKTAESATVVGANAIEAGSGAFASLAAIPIVGPAMGMAAMAAAMAAVRGLLHSASGGFDIPAGMNPLTQLHEKEMVLPAHIAQPLRENLASGGDMGGAVNHITIHAMDGASVERVLMAHPKALMAGYGNALRNGHRPKK